MSNVVEFDRVKWTGPDGTRLEVSGLRVVAGGMAVIHVPAREDAIAPVCDLACGVLMPDDGDVRYQGRLWAELCPMAQAPLRRRIGRVFEGCAWVSNLSIRENVLLQQMHQASASSVDLARDVGALAKAFGMDDIPVGRPEDLRPYDSVRLQWVRAFLGHPVLLLLEEPERDAWEEHARTLRQRTVDALETGLAAIWVTRRRDAWRDAGSDRIRHASVVEGRVVLESEGM